MQREVQQENRTPVSGRQHIQRHHRSRVFLAPHKGEAQCFQQFYGPVVVGQGDSTQAAILQSQLCQHGGGRLAGITCTFIPGQEGKPDIGAGQSIPPDNGNYPQGLHIRFQAHYKILYTGIVQNAEDIGSGSCMVGNVPVTYELQPPRRVSERKDKRGICRCQRINY